MTQAERDFHAFATLVRRIGVSIWQAASLGDTARIMDESSGLIKQAGDRMKELEGAALPAEETDYDLGTLRQQYGQERDDTGGSPPSAMG